MNKHMMLVVLTSSLLLVGAGLAEANFRPTDFNGSGVSGTVVPLSSDTVALVEEDLELDVYPEYTVGHATYVMVNEGPDKTELDIGFPVVSGPGYERLLRYELRVDGVEQASTRRIGGNVSKQWRRRLLRDIKSVRTGLKGGLREVSRGRDIDHLASFPKKLRRVYRVSRLAFAKGQRRVLDVRFVIRNELVVAGAYAPSRGANGKRTKTALVGLSYVTYLVRPARDWKGPIKRADFTVRVFGHPTWGSDWDAYSKVVLKPEPHERSGNVARWRFRDYEPKSDLRIVMPIRVVNHLERKRSWVLKKLKKPLLLGKMWTRYDGETVPRDRIVGTATESGVLLRFTAEQTVSAVGVTAPNAKDVRVTTSDGSTVTATLARPPDRPILVLDERLRRVSLGRAIRTREIRVEVLSTHDGTKPTLKDTDVLAFR